MAQQLLVDLYGCDPVLLDDPARVVAVARSVVREIGAEVVDELVHEFEPIGVTYVAIIIAVFTSYVLKRTRTGLELRAVGENPATADAAGININRYKYFSICIGCMIAGIGGLYYVLDYASGVWSNDAFGDRGWLAIALVIFSIWRPNWAIWESILFGGLYILYLYIPTGTNFAMKEIYKMLPYIVTIIVLVAISLKNRHDPALKAEIAALDEQIKALEPYLGEAKTASKSVNSELKTFNKSLK